MWLRTRTLRGAAGRAPTEAGDVPTQAGRIPTAGT